MSHARAMQNMFYIQSVSDVESDVDGNLLLKLGQAKVR